MSRKSTSPSVNIKKPHNFNCLTCCPKGPYWEAIWQPVIHQLRLTWALFCVPQFLWNVSQIFTAIPLPAFQLAIFFLLSWNFSRKQKGVIRGSSWWENSWVIGQRQKSKCLMFQNKAISRYKSCTNPWKYYPWNSVWKVAISCSVKNHEIKATFKKWGPVPDHRFCRKLILISDSEL